MFDPKITEQMRVHLDTPQSERDYDNAAEILLIVSGNVIQYQMFRRKGAKNFASLIDKKIKDLYDFRLAKLTHRQVAEMSVKAQEIVADSEQQEEFIKAGKRSDHDDLPHQIQAYYKEALDCLRQERELHMQIRRLALAQTTCPDSEIYPFVKEILRVDDRRLKLWQLYDTYNREHNPNQ